MSEANQFSQFARVKGFDDDTVTGSYGDKPEMYRAEQGRTDVVRLITLPVEYYNHYVRLPNSNKAEGFYINCAAPLELIDADNPTALMQHCPACAEGNEARRRFCVLMVWLWSEKGGRTQVRNTVLPWSMPPDKYAILREIQKTLTPGPDGKRDIRRVDLRIACTDTNFQKMTIMSNNTTTEVPAEVVQDLRSMIVTGGNIHNPLDVTLIRQVIEPTSKREMVAALRRASGEQAADPTTTRQWQPQGQQQSQPVADNPPINDDPVRSAPPAQAPQQSGGNAVNNNPNTTLNSLLGLA